MHLGRQTLCTKRRLQLRGRFGIDQDSMGRFELPTLCEQLRRVAMCAKRDDSESIRMTRDHIERVVTNGAR